MGWRCVFFKVWLKGKQTSNLFTLEFCSQTRFEYHIPDKHTVCPMPTPLPHYLPNLVNPQSPISQSLTMKSEF